MCSSARLKIGPCPTWGFSVEASCPDPQGSDTYMAARSASAFRWREDFRWTSEFSTRGTASSFKAKVAKQTNGFFSPAYDFDQQIHCAGLPPDPGAHRSGMRAYH